MTDNTKLIRSWISFFKEQHDKHLRFGQYFINHHCPTTICPSVFYEQNNLKAMGMLVDHFINKNPIRDWTD